MRFRISGTLRKQVPWLTGLVIVASPEFALGQADAAKGGDTKHVPLNSEAVEVLKHWRKQSTGERVFAVDTSPTHIGLAASPKLTYYRDARFAGRHWRVGMTGGLEFGSSKLHDYFYSVDPMFQTPDRPAYRAESGYAGTRFTLSAQSRQGNNWIGAFIRYDDVSDAVFDDSPLVGRSGNLSAGIVVGWFVARSKRMVEVPEEEAL